MKLIGIGCLTQFPLLKLFSSLMLFQNGYLCKKTKQNETKQGYYFSIQKKRAETVVFVSLSLPLNTVPEAQNYTHNTLTKVGNA